MSDDEQELVSIRIELASDGSCCALDATDTMIAQGEDLGVLTADVHEVVRMAFGPLACPILRVGSVGQRLDSQG